MRILHTSDLHLSEDKPETLEALKEILRVAKKKSVELVTIAGDMFDSDRDANALRPQLRSVLSGNGFPILVIPGNHDRNSFTANTYYGDDLEVVVTEPFQTKSYGDVAITALPYLENPDETLIDQLKKAKKRGKKNILLLHCTLDFAFRTSDFGDEKEIKYFPISSQTISNLEYDYVLGGHFHSNQFEKKLDSGGIFIYPGSPVSISMKESGKRCALILDTEKGTRQFTELNTFYYDNRTFNVFPGGEQTAINKIKTWVLERTGSNCKMTIEVNGFISTSEKSFNSKLQKVGNGANLISNYRSVKDILDYPLYTRFSQRLNVIESLEDRQKLEMLVLKVISRLSDTRGLQI